MKRKSPPTLETFKNRKLKQQKKNHFNDFLKDEIQETEVLQIIKSSESQKSNLESKKELELLVKQFLKYTNNANTIQIVHFLNKNSTTLKVDVSLLTSKILCFIFKKQNPHIEVIFNFSKFFQDSFFIDQRIFEFSNFVKKNFLGESHKRNAGEIGTKNNIPIEL
jgi:hypothetical protein